MAKTQTASQKPRLTRGKALLIAVLAIVLMAVLYVQYGRYASGAGAVEVETVAGRVPARQGPRTAAVAPVTAATETEDDIQSVSLEFDQTKWQPPELSKVIAYDPFALPASFPQPSSMGAMGLTEGDDALTAEEKSKQLADALAQLRTELDELKQRGVHVIVGQKGQYVAQIGDRTIHVGDEIGNGFTVTEIDPKDGVRVDWKGPE